ncbi:MAG TPA: aminotransferase class III-fold pyridoxal phosphate-dependent enzyme, partial [Planctomycetota bacterium]|nr:aminotransferase class III-fold pyridoxal phosphate-dependent enzyme [Planctomycetota bacterium]
MNAPKGADGNGAIRPEAVHATLRRYMLADGLELVLDLGGSRGSWVRDAVSGETFLDCFTCFASWGIGYHHPLLDTAEFRDEMLEAATHNPSNSDLYTPAMAEFVAEFGKALPPGYGHLFLVSGGTLAVENALKAAFDWKVRLNLSRGAREEQGTQVIHLRNAFHGRSGYT